MLIRRISLSSAALVCGLLFGIAVPLTACLWDRDTLAAERMLFPEALDVMTGNFPRHSQEFYAWRMLAAEKKLAKDPTLISLYDDLAVAQHKLGDHAGAIATMFAKEKIKPGLYETYSNLGTFYIYTGDLAEAVKWIDKALVINPDAHFGREKYQKWLVEWRLSGQVDTLPANTISPIPPYGFAAFIARKQAEPNVATSDKLELTKEQRDAAIKGILGMMRFADFDNPLLQEALGDVLITGKWGEASRQLAGDAYYLAQLKSPPANRPYLHQKQELAGIADKWTRSFSMALAVGANRATAIRENELKWMKMGLDAEVEFQQQYIAVHDRKQPSKPVHEAPKATP